MEHVYFFDGNTKRISWVIQNDSSKFEQFREQAEYYLDQVSIEQSKYIALHVGIFWGVGCFIIKNGDIVKIMIDSKLIYHHLLDNSISHDFFIERRTNFIKQLFEQRKLIINYELIDPNQNIASRMLIF